MQNLFKEGSTFTRAENFPIWEIGGVGWGAVVISISLRFVLFVVMLWCGSCGAATFRSMSWFKRIGEDARLNT